MSRIISKIICILFLLLPVHVFAKTTVSEINSVNIFMKTFIQAYEKRELNALIQLYDANAIVIGTGKDEILQGRKQIMAGFKRDLDQQSRATITMTPIAVDVENNIAFAAYNLSVNVQLPDNKSFQSLLRFSVGLIKHGNSWFVMQSHLSAPLVGQEDG